MYQASSFDPDDGESARWCNTRVVTAPTSALKKLLPLLVAGTLGRLPTVTLPIASLLLVADRSSLTRGGLASGALSLGTGGIGVVVGRHLDSHRAARVLILLALAHVPAIALFIALAGTDNTAALIGVSFVAGASVAPVGPVVRALLAQNADPAQVQRIFAWDSMSVEVSWIGGPLLVSGAILLGGPAFAVALSPVLAAIGVAAVARQPVRHVAHVGAARRWLTAPLIQLVIAFAFAGTAFRMLIVAVAEVARLQGHDEWTGAMLAFWAVGSLLGAWVVSIRGMPSVPMLGVSVAVSVGLIGLGQSSIWATAALAFISGVPTAPFVAGLNTLVSKVTVEGAHVRAFASMQAANTVMAAVGAAVGSAAIDRWGPAIVSIPATLLLLGSARLAVIDGHRANASRSAAAAAPAGSAAAGSASAGSGLVG